MSDRAWVAGNGNQVQSFRYPVIPRPAFGGRDVLDLGPAEAGRDARERARQQELATAVEAARKQGFSEGQAQATAASAQALAQERSAISTAVGDFAQQRADYFRRVESELVRLALSIARKVLDREARMDPLLLAGVVRVALDQMQAGTRLVLRTSPDAAEVWRQFCARQEGDKQSVEVVPDSSVIGHGCILQAEAGSTEISLDSQLQEIESGFFDLLRGHPGAEP
ncbi:MAG: FliH/SctL family protein [Candidatus Korobacteraceae bacterium]